MRLNKGKCEAITINGSDPIRYKDGSTVPPQNKVKYLGRMINDKGDPKAEISKRIAECIAIWR